MKNSAEIKSAQSELESFVSLTIFTLPEGSTIDADMLSKSHDRAKIRKLLIGMEDKGIIFQVLRGKYVPAIYGHDSDQLPSLKLLVSHYSEITGQTIVVGGSICAAQLGLISDEGKRLFYLTDGRSQWMKYDGEMILLKHCRGWMLTNHSSDAGVALRGLIWMGDNGVHHNLMQVKRSLSEHEWLRFIESAHLYPAWLRAGINEAK